MTAGVPPLLDFHVSHIAERTNLAAGLQVLTATAIFALIFTSGRFVDGAASALQIMFLRYAGGFLTVLVVARFRGETWRSMQSANRGKQILRALAGGLGGAMIIYGNSAMPILDATAIGLVSPVFVVCLGVFALKDRLIGLQVIGGLLCASGAVVVVLARGAFTESGAIYLLPTIVVIVSALLLAGEVVLIRILALVDRPLVTLAHANLFGMAILLIPALLTWRSTGPLNLTLLMLGPLAILGQFLNIKAFTKATVSALAPLSYASLIFAALLGWVFFAEQPAPAVVLGALLVAAGGIVIATSRR
jgi:drug/metabolite transporter (DMT)-like permease